jgi:Amt family ammonium transporter
MKYLLMVGGILLLFTVPALADNTTTASSYNVIDTFWILLTAFLVFFMQAGFALVEVGMVRAKNAANIMMKNLMDFCVGSIGFFIFGYAIMFGGTDPLFGTTGWFLSGAESIPGIPLYAFWMFQAAFCGTAATIVSGGVAERMKFSSYLIYSFIISAFIYPIVGHWVWGGGWLAKLNFHDFAGSTVVHAIGGFTALVGTMLLKPRIGKFNSDGSPNLIAGHNMTLVTVGVFILWLGWFGFNPGSTLGFADPVQVGRITVNTSLAAAAGAIAGMLVSWAKSGKPDLALTLTGTLAGLVGITAPCSVVNPINAIFIGSIAGVISVYGVYFLDRVGIDDPVGAISVHGFGGVFGTLAVGLFGQASLGSPNDGLFYGGGFYQLGIQALGTSVSVIFVMVTMWIVFKALDSFIGLRVSEKEELMGLDLTEHGMESYSGFQIFLTE